MYGGQVLTVHFKMESLPDEILLHIFSYLTTRERLHSLGPVCKRFNLLTKDKSSWLELHVKKSDSLTTNSCCLLLTGCKHLRELDLVTKLPWQKGWKSHLVACDAMRRCPKLYSLKVRLTATRSAVFYRCSGRPRMSSSYDWTAPGTIKNCALTPPVYAISSVSI